MILHVRLALCASVLPDMRPGLRSAPNQRVCLPSKCCTANLYVVHRKLPVLHPLDTEHGYFSYMCCISLHPAT